LIDPITIGVDGAVDQTLLSGGGVPDYVPRTADAALLAALAAAVDGREPWIVLVMGPSKVGKSRSLFQALREWAKVGDRSLDVIAPADAEALRLLMTLGPDVGALGSHAVLWLDDIELFLNEGVTMSTLRAWRAGEAGRVVVATYGGKGRERVAASAVSGLANIANDVLRCARRVVLKATTPEELGSIGSRLSDEQHFSQAHTAPTRILARTGSISCTPPLTGHGAVAPIRSHMPRCENSGQATRGRGSPQPRTDLRRRCRGR
jgi:hypothetical protein